MDDEDILYLAIAVTIFMLGFTVGALICTLFG